MTNIWRGMGGVALSLIFALVLVPAAQAVEGLGKTKSGDAAAAKEDKPTGDDFDSGMKGGGDKAGGNINCDQESCQRVSGYFLLAIALVDLACILLAFLMWWLVTRKLWWNPLARFLIPALLWAAVAMVIIALNPFSGDTYKCCLSAKEYSKYIILFDLTAWPKGALVGAAPTLVGFLLVLILKGLVRKLRRG